MTNVVVRHVVVAFLLGLALWATAVGSNPSRAFAQSLCSPLEQATTQQMCTPVSNGAASQNAVTNWGNRFPYGQCTWWANERYHQLQGVYVPWGGNAWQWRAGAYAHGWHVSSWPTVGAIVVLQPWVQGAGGLGHVAVVERVLSNGHAISSNMNWGLRRWQVTYVEFAPGYGVSFVRA
ncbi:MAG TPA: CHAP domain-containing protein [Ktedonosporobacter sp.]|nr:CHAP domain-containing protein [Ktedonosporobacter sp.]